MTLFFPSPGKVVRVTSDGTGSLKTGSTLIPYDNSRPTLTEGNQVMQLGYTKLFASTRIITFGWAMMSYSVAANIIMTVFSDQSNSSAVACAYAGAGELVTLMTTMEGINPSVGAQTAELRAGGDVAGTLTVGGVAGATKFGAVAPKYGLTVVEFWP